MRAFYSLFQFSNDKSSLESQYCTGRTLSKVDDRYHKTRSSKTDSSLNSRRTLKYLRFRQISSVLIFSETYSQMEQFKIRDILIKMTKKFIGMSQPKLLSPNHTHTLENRKRIFAGVTLWFFSFSVCAIFIILRR